MIGTRVTGATRTASAHDRQRPFGTHLLAAGWAYGKSCPWRHSKPQYMQGRISLICDDDSPTNKSRPFGRRRQRNRTEGAKATFEGCGYLEGRQVAPHRDWPALSFRIVRCQVHEHADAPHALALLRARLPLIIGSAGSAGAKPHLEQTLAIIREIAREEGLSFRMGVLRADIERTVLKTALRSNGVVPIDGMAMLDATEVDAAANIVGQMGMSAFQRALVEIGRASCREGVLVEG